MDYKATDFPFTIMDVASLLRLNIRRRGAGHIYVDCPICGDRRGKMNLNLTKNVWRCNYCGEGGGMLALYAKVYRISNSDAYKEICDALQTGSTASAYSTPSPAGSNKEMPQAERAGEQEIHRTFTTMMSALSLTPAHREHLRSKRGLTDAQIDQFGFKSTPPPEFCRILARQLAEFGYRVQGVPGFYIDDYGKWTIKFHRRTSGILIPIRSVEGLLCGLQTRLDKPIRDIEAENMDKYSNDMVNKGASKVCQLAVKHGMTCRRLVWNPNYKGIDDWQLALHRKNEIRKEDVTINMEQQLQLFRVYQLDLEGIKTYPLFHRNVLGWMGSGLQGRPRSRRPTGNPTKDCSIPGFGVLLL